MALLTRPAAVTERLHQLFDYVEADPVRAVEFTERLSEITVGDHLLRRRLSSVFETFGASHTRKTAISWGALKKREVDPFPAESATLSFGKTPFTLPVLSIVFSYLYETREIGTELPRFYRELDQTQRLSEIVFSVRVEIATDGGQNKGLYNADRQLVCLDLSGSDITYDELVENAAQVPKLADLDLSNCTSFFHNLSFREIFYVLPHLKVLKAPILSLQHLLILEFQKLFVGHDDYKEAPLDGDDSPTTVDDVFRTNSKDFMKAIVLLARHADKADDRRFYDLLNKIAFTLGKDEVAKANKKLCFCQLQMGSLYLPDHGQDVFDNLNEALYILQTDAPDPFHRIKIKLAREIRKLREFYTEKDLLIGVLVHQINQDPCFALNVIQFVCAQQEEGASPSFPSEDRLRISNDDAENLLKLFP